MENGAKEHRDRNNISGLNFDKSLP